MSTKETGRTIVAKYLGNNEVESHEIADAARVLRASRREANLLLKEVRLRAAGRLRRRREIAWQNGYNTGAVRGRELWLGKVAEAEQLYRDTVESARMDCFTAVREVAEAVVGELAAESTAYLVERIRSALQMLIQKRGVKVLVSESQAESCRKALRAALPDRDIAIEGAGEIAPGDALIQASGGRIEIRWRDHLGSMLDHIEPSRLAAA